MSGRLIAWLALISAQIAVNYGSRATGGKPEKNALYHWNLAAGGLVQYLFFLAIVLAIAWPEPRRLLALRRPRAWGTALALGVGVYVAVGVLNQLLDPVLHGGDEQGLKPSGWQSSHAAAFAANFVVIAIVAPIVEELTFRGVGYSLLERRSGTPLAIIETGVLFGLAHGLVEALPVLVAFGIGLAWVRSRTGSVYPGILLHAAFNGIALVLAVST